MNKKILYFDYWTKGLQNNIAQLDSLLEQRGFNRIMVHLGSWRSVNVIEQEIIDGLLCRDISMYKNNLRNMLANERPDVLYTLNVGGVVDRLINRICRNLGVPVVFMMHGIPPLGKNIDLEKKRLNKGYGLLKRLSKIPKYLHIYFQYFFELLFYSPVELLHPITYKHPMQMLLSPGSIYSAPCKDKDLSPNLCLVYAPAYRDFYQETLGFNPKDIKIVGNPNLDDVLSSINEISMQRLSLERPLVVFIVDGFENGLAHSFTKEDWIQELRDVAGVIEKLGGDLILKLHPSNDRALVESEFRGAHWVKVVQNEVNLSIVKGACAAIGHISSALLAPIALKIPIFIPGWTPVYADYDYYVANNVARVVDSTTDLLRLLRFAATNACSSTSVGGEPCFIKNYIGHMDGKSWSRVANEIEFMLSAK